MQVRQRVLGESMSELVQEQISNEATLVRYCRRCHRRLKAKISMETGYGPVCLLKHLHGIDERGRE